MPPIAGLPIARLLIVGLLIASLLCGACGYHLAGHSTVLPPTLRSITIADFDNHTRVPRLGQMIGAATSREFLRRTAYRLEPDPQASDMVLHGAVLSLEATPVTFDAASGRATTVELRLHLQVSLVANADKRVLFHNDDMLFHEQYQIGSLDQNFFEEDQAAYQRLSAAAAKTLVSDILENF